METCFLYTNRNHFDSDVIRALLLERNVRFEEIDVSIPRVAAFFKYDFGVERTPALVTGNGIFAGVGAILQELNSLDSR